jgi:hypothetical protein
MQSKKILRALLSAAALTALVSCEDMLKPEPENENGGKEGLSLVESVFAEPGLYSGASPDATAINVSEGGNDDLFLDAIAWMAASSGANVTAETEYHLVLESGDPISVAGKQTIDPAGKTNVTLVIEKTKGSAAVERVIDFRFSGGLGLQIKNMTLRLGAGITLTGEEGKNAPLVTVGQYQSFVGSGSAVLELTRGSAIKDYKSVSTTGGAVHAACGKVLVIGGSISGCTSNGSGAAVYVNYAGFFEMKSGEITENTSNTTDTLQGAINTGGSGQIKISGGTITNTDERTTAISSGVAGGTSAHPVLVTLAGNPVISGIETYANNMNFPALIYLEDDFTGSVGTLIICTQSSRTMFTGVDTGRTILKWVNSENPNPLPVSRFQNKAWYHYTLGFAYSSANGMGKNPNFPPCAIDSNTGCFEPKLVYNDNHTWSQAAE